MDCSDFRRHHVAYVDDTLPGDLVVAAARHAAECRACARQDTAVRRSLLLARNLARTAAPLECSADFAARLEARLAVVRSECAERGTAGAARATPADAALGGDGAYDRDWAPSWRELAAARIPSRLRARPAAAAAAALLALTTGASFHSADEQALGHAGAIAAAMAPFGSPFSPPPAPMAVAVEEPVFQPDAGRVVTYVTYDDGSTADDGTPDASALLVPAATGNAVWAAAMLAGEAPAVLWRAAGSRPSGRRGVAIPRAQLVSEVRETR